MSSIFPSDRPTRWWVFGDYTGDCCPNCGRDRLMSCTDDSGVNRVICEKCNFEPAKGIYLSEALD